MIIFLNNFKARKLKAISYKLNRGMTYVELIVVLSIFSVMTSVVLFNYGEFQAKIDIKNLASDIALKVVEAQKSALSGKLPPSSHSPQNPLTWKPSYGVYFNLTNNLLDPDEDDKSFIYFVDLNNNKQLNDNGNDCAVECLNKITITKGNRVCSIKAFPNGTNLKDLTVTFSRPNSGAMLSSDGSPLGSIGNIVNYVVTYVQINIISPQGVGSNIKIYASGRIQVNNSSTQVNDCAP